MSSRVQETTTAVATTTYETTKPITTTEEKYRKVLLWKSTSEKNQPVPDEIQKQLDMYRNKKYRVIIMYSGSEDLFEPTLVLLLKNRMNKAMKEAEQELIEGKAAV